MRYRMLGFIVLAMAIASAHAADVKAPDSQWTIKLTPAASNKLKGTTQPYDDVVTFKGGKFSTAVNSKYGFDPVVCAVKNEGGKIIVSAELSDEKHGKNVYEFEVKGTTLAGTMKWSKTGEDGKPKVADYTVSGTMR